MRGHTEPQVVKMKLRTTGRPSFISCGSQTTLPSSRTNCTAGMEYCEVEVLMAGVAAKAGAPKPRLAASPRHASAVAAAHRGDRVIIPRRYLQSRRGTLMLIPTVGCPLPPIHILANPTARIAKTTAAAALEGGSQLRARPSRRRHSGACPGAR